MKPLLPALLFSLGLSQAAVTPAAAYPVDCAILLCLAGGWPASAECALARAVFILNDKGLTLYRYVEPTPLTRRDSAELVQVVEELKAQKLV